MTEDITRIAGHCPRCGRPLPPDVAGGLCPACLLGAGIETLTPAERRILRLIASDKTSKEIADELGLSPRTVENHRTNMSSKLGLHGAHSLVKFAFENKGKV